MIPQNYTKLRIDFLKQEIDSLKTQWEFETNGITKNNLEISIVVLEHELEELESV